MWDWSFAWQSLPTLIDGLGVTLQASVLASALALVVGLVLALVRISGIPVLSHLAIAFIEFLRGTPILIQLYFLFYVLPQFGVTLSALATGVLALGLSFSAYMAEVYRAGIQQVPTGQWEVARVLGFRPRHMWAKVVLPQAVRNVIPPLGSYIVYMFKETALLSVVTVHELLASAQAMGAQHYRYVEPLVLAAVLYFVISYPTAYGIRRLEGRLAHGS